LVDDLFRRRTGDDDVRKRLHRGRTIDVAERDMIGMLGAEAGELIGRATVLETATGGHEIGRATSELQSLMRISYAVFCLKKTNTDLNHYLSCALLLRSV